MRPQSPRPILRRSWATFPTLPGSECSGGSRPTMHRHREERGQDMTFAEPDKAVRPMAYVVSSGVRSRLSDRLHPGIADANVARSGPTTLGPRTTDAATPRSPFDRGRSRLRFDARLLGLAEDPRQPLMERVKALAMHDQHLDEFFQVRVAGLLEQVRAGVSTEGPDGMTPGQQLEAIRERVQTL